MTFQGCFLGKIKIYMSINYGTINLSRWWQLFNQFPNDITEISAAKVYFHL